MVLILARGVCNHFASLVPSMKAQYLAFLEDILTIGCHLESMQLGLIQIKTSI